MNIPAVKSFCVVLLFSMILVGCGSGGVKVSANFSNSQDISEGATVFLDGTEVGKVDDISEKGQGSTVVIALTEKRAKDVYQGGAVVFNRLKSPAVLEIYNPNVTEPMPVEDGAELTGLDSMFQLGAWMVGDAIQVGGNTLSDYVNAFQEYLNGEQFAQDKKAVQEQVGVATEQAKTAIDQVGKEIDSAMTELSDNEGAVSESIKQLGDELAPVVGELSESAAQIIAQIEAFTQGLQNKTAEEQQAGESFLDVLTATLEQLNQAAQRAADSSAQSPTPESPSEDSSSEEPSAKEEPSVK